MRQEVGMDDESGLLLLSISTVILTHSSGWFTLVIADATDISSDGPVDHYG